MSSSTRPTAVRGPAITFTGDPFRDGLERTMVHEPDAIVAMADGRVTHFGPASTVSRMLPSGIEVRDYGRDSLISAGFVDTHVHFPQTPMIASHGAQLLDWLDRYTFPTELKFADREYTRRVARTFLNESLRNGITTSCVYCTVHAHSADILFEEAEALGLRLAAGKVLMDRNAPDGLCDTAQSGYDDSRALIAKCGDLSMGVGLPDPTFFSVFRDSLLLMFSFNADWQQPITDRGLLIFSLHATVGVFMTILAFARFLALLPPPKTIDDFER